MIRPLLVGLALLLTGVGSAAPSAPAPVTAPDPCDTADESHCDNSIRLGPKCDTPVDWQYNGWCQYPGVFLYLTI